MEIGQSKEQALIQSVINAELIFQRHVKSAIATPPVVALSRDYGAGGNAVAQLVAQHLGIELFDRQILDGIARDSKVEPHLMEKLDEKVSQDKKTAWVRSLFTNNTEFPESYRYHLVNIILGICQKGGVIIGRGAHVILSARPVFRVRIVGTVDRCAERVAEKENISIEEAIGKVSAVNKQRDDFVWQMFKRRLHDATLFDLVVNTDRYSKAEAAADLILTAMVHTGLIKPD